MFEPGRHQSRNSVLLLADELGLTNRNNFNSIELMSLKSFCKHTCHRTHRNTNLLVQNFVEARKFFLLFVCLGIWNLFSGRTRLASFLYLLKFLFLKCLYLILSHLIFLRLWEVNDDLWVSLVVGDLSFIGFCRNSAWFGSYTSLGSSNRMQRFRITLFLLLLLLVPNLMVQPIDETLSKRVSVVIVLILHHTSIQVQRLVHSRE